MTVPPVLVGRAVSAAAAVAARHGLAFEEASLLGGHSNTMVLLRPLPLVARVASGTGRVRTGLGWLARELAVASFLARRGAPAIRPSDLLAPGPHEHDGLGLSFWRLAEPTGEPVSPHAAGAALRRCHEALASFPGELPRLGLLEETRRLLGHPLVATALDVGQRAAVEGAADLLHERLAVTPVTFHALHGDAHVGNVWHTCDGPIWGDWEDTFAGPIEWDLACLVAGSRLLGDGNAAAAALAGYGKPFDEELFELMLDCRALQAVVWSTINRGKPHGDWLRFLLSRVERLRRSGFALAAPRRPSALIPST